MIYAALILYTLTASWVNGTYRYCQYSNGEVHAIHAANPCPHVISR